MKYCFLRYPEGKYKALTLSYDDGQCYDKRLVEIANKHGISVTLNINSSILSDKDGEFILSVSELKDILTSGNHEIAVHGAQHIALGKATPAVGIQDVLDCKRTLEQKLGRIIRGMAYADSGILEITESTSKDTIKTYLPMLGIAYSRSLAGDNDRFGLPTDFYEWIPTAHHSHPKLMEWLEQFLDKPLSNYCASRTPRLFYMWGHSFEFARQNNWEVLERFCERAGGHDDVWYATNIEICDYVRAYQSLVFNTDRSMVYNPTDKEIWFEADGRLLSVRSGETVNI